jgi:large subunit ribosomal protein L24
MKFSKGDSVVILTGKDKGKKGQILRVIAGESRVVVSGVNMVTKHVKKTVQSAGSTVKFERSIHASNVAIVDPKTGKATRIGYKIIDGKKVRIAKKSGTPLERVKKVAEETKASAPKATAGAKPAAPKKASFWSRGKGPAVDTGVTERVEAAPPQANVTHTRSAGRGS